MNQHYLNRYYKFIESLKEQTINGYYERHHIVPKSLGGGDEDSNIILLTPRQHYVAHWMLWKAYKGSMTTAFHYMSGIKRYGKRLNSKTFDLMKQENAANQKTKIISDTTREKLRQAKLGKKLSPEHIEKVRQASLGRKYSDETKRKVSESKKGIATRGAGWRHSEETKLKMKQAQQRRYAK